MPPCCDETVPDQDSDVQHAVAAKALARETAQRPIFRQRCFLTNYPDAARSSFPVHYPMQTRWRDNDVYGHMNNVVYYEYFDTAVNRWLIESGVLQIPDGPIVGLVAETSCAFKASVGFPGEVSVGVSTLKIGKSSVVYGLGLFAADSTSAAALCRYVHVYVDQKTRKPVPIPAEMRQCLEKLNASDSPK